VRAVYRVCGAAERFSRQRASSKYNRNGEAAKFRKKLGVRLTGICMDRMRREAGSADARRSVPHTERAQTEVSATGDE
jgi:Arc/MetJ family transcription regulator